MERSVSLNSPPTLVGAFRHTSSLLHRKGSEASTSARPDPLPASPAVRTGRRGNICRSFGVPWSRKCSNCLQVAASGQSDDNLVSSQTDTGLPQFHTIPEALEDIAAGKFVVVLDDEDRENEGDLIIAGDRVTTESMAFMVEYTSGVICIAMEGQDLDRLELPLMINSSENEEAMRTAFTVTVDLDKGITTGISAADRSNTIRSLSNPQSKASDFRRPGHIFPLRYQPGGTIVRAGHTEAAVDLARMAGCYPAGVLCEIVDKRDGSMARTPQLLEFAKENDLKCITIADLIKYRLEHDTVIERVGSKGMETSIGMFEGCCYRSTLDGSEYIAFVTGNLDGGRSVNAHIRSADFLGDALSSELTCGLRWMDSQGQGVIIYALGTKHKTLSAFESLQMLGEAQGGYHKKMDLKDHAVAVQILQDLGVESVFLVGSSKESAKVMENMGMKVEGVKVVSSLQVLEDLSGPAGSLLNGSLHEEFV